MIDDARLHRLNAHLPGKGRCVLYWMQASQRTRLNHALEHAISRANERNEPLVVGFGLMDDYPEANARHYDFMLRGLADVHASLGNRGIEFCVRHGSPPEIASELARDASLVVCDAGYLRHQRQWRTAVARKAKVEVVEVESDVVVPVRTASNKLEFAARTLRPKINTLLERFLQPIRSVEIKKSANFKVGGNLDVTDPARLLQKLKVDRSVAPTRLLEGGEVAARRELKRFVAGPLRRYAEGRREPAQRGTSMMAAYLHFGQISPIEIALAVKKAKPPQVDEQAYLEELIVRRELAMNFVFYREAYDRFRGLPAWAIQTLKQHQRDPRPVLYSAHDLEAARTDDPYWNAAQKEMLLSGYMHNMMRMYWGKKILEWTASPRAAFDLALRLNNKYFLCGRDPASYANVGWLFGLHDRPWGRRKIFGTVRYMNAAGLKRKFDMPAYLAKVEAMEREYGPTA